MDRKPVVADGYRFDGRARGQRNPLDRVGSILGSHGVRPLRGRLRREIDDPHDNGHDPGHDEQPEKNHDEDQQTLFGGTWGRNARIVGR